MRRSRLAPEPKTAVVVDKRGDILCELLEHCDVVCVVALIAARGLTWASGDPLEEIDVELSDRIARRVQ